MFLPFIFIPLTNWTYHRNGHLEKIYERHFGQDYPEIKRIRQWLEKHPERDRIVAFFNDPDPFSP